MHDPAVEQEKLLQYRIDREGYRRLSTNEKKAVRLISGNLLKKRRALVGIGRLAIGVAEMAFNVVLRLPYTLAAKGVARLAKGTIGLVKLSVGGAAAVKRSVFASRRGGLKIAAAAVSFLRKRNFISPAAGGRLMQNFAARRNELLSRAMQTKSWAINRKQQIDHAWEDAKKKMKEAREATLAFLEYYGALGLYKTTSWVLDPHTPSGKPLLGNERLNKTVGAVAAGGLFVFLAFEISKLAVMAKLWHLKVARSFVTDTSSLVARLAKQALFHPMLTAGVTALKFFGLPVVAATRRVLKSTDFTQGIGFKYNSRLNALERLQARREFALSAALPEAPSLRTIWDSVRGVMHQRSLAFVEKFVAHVVEKASPAFYEARIKHYDGVKNLPPPAPPKELPRLEI